MVCIQHAKPLVAGEGYYMTITNNNHRAGRCSSSASRHLSSKIGRGGGPSIASHNFCGFSQFVRINTGIIFRLIYDHLYKIAFNCTCTDQLTKIQGSKMNCRTTSFRVRRIYRRLEKHKRKHTEKGDVTD